VIEETRVDPDLRALRALYEEHATALLRLGVALTGDVGAAEDLVHDAFLRFHAVGARPGLGAERAYLRRTVVNLSLDRGRHQQVQGRLAPPPRPDVPSAEADVLAVVRDRAVAAAVAALPPRQRACVVLHYFAGLSDAEVAADLGVSVGSVKTHLHRARAALARRLEDLR